MMNRNPKYGLGEVVTISEELRHKENNNIGMKVNLDCIVCGVYYEPREGGTTHFDYRLHVCNTSTANSGDKTLYRKEIEIQKSGEQQ